MTHLGHVRPVPAASELGVHPKHPKFSRQTQKHLDRWRPGCPQQQSCSGSPRSVSSPVPCLCVTVAWTLGSHRLQSQLLYFPATSPWAMTAVPPGPRPRRGSLRAPASELVAEPNSGQVLVTHHTWPVTDSSRMSGLCCFRSQVQQHPQRRTSFSSPRVGSPGLFVTGMVYACCVLGFTVGRWISPQRSPWCGRTRGRLHPAAPPGFRHTRRPAAHEDKPHLFRDVRRKTAFRNLRAPVSNAATREQDAEYWGLLQFT